MATKKNLNMNREIVEKINKSGPKNWSHLVWNSQPCRNNNIYSYLTIIVTIIVNSILFTILIVYINIAKFSQQVRNSQNVFDLGDDVFRAGTFLLWGRLLSTWIHVQFGQLVLSQSQTHTALLSAKRRTNAHIYHTNTWCTAYKEAKV